MVELTPVVIVGIGVAAFIIGFAKAGIGGSIGPLTTIVAVIVLPTRTALAILLPLLMVGDAFALGALWRRWDTREVLRLLPGAAVGVAAGTYLLAQADSPALRRLLGALILVFVAYWVFGQRLVRLAQRRPQPWYGWLAGAVAGVTSALAHSGGPPVAAYLLLKGLEPVRFVATTALVFAIVNLIKVPSYLAAGLFDLELQRQLAWAVLVIPVGVVVGRLLVERIDRRLFHRASVVLLTISAVYLLLA